MRLTELKDNGYYLQVSNDDRKNMKQYEIVKDLNEDKTYKEVYGELNRSGYLKAKNELGLQVVNRESNFLNFIISLIFFIYN